MTMVQTTSEHSPSGSVHCPRCEALLPPHATFCGSCGERVGKEKMVSPPTQDTSTMDQENAKIDSDSQAPLRVPTTSRYHVTALVRQRPYVELSFAVDTQLQRTVVIRNIDISSLDEEAQAKASEVVQNEYDLLRQQGIAHVMPVIDVQHSQGHLLTIMSQAVFNKIPGAQKDTAKSLRTLQDFLAHGKDAPGQQTSLAWISRLCQSLEGLHQHQIVIGDLDPSAILMDGDNQNRQPLLMVSWLPPQLRKFFSRLADKRNESPSPSTHGGATALATAFSAPEVLLGKVEPVSDVYSLGAILYLLLTGTAPDRPMQRIQQRLRSPDELNSRISSGLAEITMQALALEPSERFQSVKELAQALSSGHASQGVIYHARTNHALGRDQLADMDTINIIPMRPSKNVPRPLWEEPTTSLNTSSVRNQSPLALEKPISGEQTSEPQASVREIPAVQGTRLGASPPTTPYDDTDQDGSVRGGTSLVQQFTQQISGMLPAIPNLPKQITDLLSTGQRTSQSQAEQPQERMWPLPISRVGKLLTKPDATASDGSSLADEPLLKHIQRILVGERKQTTTAATIENPLRIQPDQSFNIRIRLTGRNEPDVGLLPRGHASTPGRPHSRLYGTMEGVPSSGLGARVQDDLVYVEVRSAIHENYAYIVQQAAVKIPAQGYVAEIVIPMQPFSRKSNGRRERLHVFFFDDMRRPLYERPFVLEILVSYLVQPGREGHHILPIPQ